MVELVSSANVAVAQLITNNLWQRFYQFNPPEVFCLRPHPVTSEHYSCHSPVLQKLRDYPGWQVHFRFVQLKVLGLDVDVGVMTQQLSEHLRPGASSVQATMVKRGKARARTANRLG